MTAFDEQQSAASDANLRKALDGWYPTHEQVVAAMRAFDIAEGTEYARHPTSFVSTFSEVLVAAHDAVQDTWTCGRCGTVRYSGVAFRDHLIAGVVNPCRPQAAGSVPAGEPRG